MSLEDILSNMETLSSEEDGELTKLHQSLLDEATSGLSDIYATVLKVDLLIMRNRILEKLLNEQNTQEIPEDTLEYLRFLLTQAFNIGAKIGSLRAIHNASAFMNIADLTYHKVVKELDDEANNESQEQFPQDLPGD